MKLGLSLVVVTLLVLQNAAFGEERRITGIFGVRIGSDAWSHQLVGNQKVIDTGRLALEWEYRINPVDGSPDLGAYYVRFNPTDRSIYQIIGESGKLPPQECPAALAHIFRIYRHAFPKHPFDFDGVSTFVIGAMFPGESDIIGECFANDRVLRIYAFNALRYRRHQAENRDRRP